VAGVPGGLVAGLGCVAGVVTPCGVAGVSVGLVVVQATSAGVVVGVTCVSAGAVAVGVASGGFGVPLTVVAGFFLGFKRWGCCGLAYLPRDLLGLMGCFLDAMVGWVMGVYRRLC
jgi:hypothetical protein